MTAARYWNATAGIKVLAEMACCRETRTPELAMSPADHLLAQPDPETPVMLAYQQRYRTGPKETSEIDRRPMRALDRSAQYITVLCVARKLHHGKCT